MIDVRKIRNDLNLTQEAFAKALGERQDTVSRLEKTKVDDIPIGVLMKIARLTGRSLDELMQFEKAKPEGIPLENKWQIVDEFKSGIRERLASAPMSEIEFVTDQLFSILDEFTRKPRIIISSGQYASGKSALANYLTGLDICPTGARETSSVPIYIKHICERPRKLSDTVFIFRLEKDTGCFDIDWFDKGPESSGARGELLAASGGPELISKFCDAQGENYSVDIAAALVYAESDILNLAMVVDTPSHKPMQDNMYRWVDYGIGKPYAVLVFLSPASYFLENGDTLTILRKEVEQLSYLENAYEYGNSIKPLGNLFILESLAHVLGDDDEFSRRERRDPAILRFERTLPGSLADFFSARNTASGFRSEVYFKSRMFTFATDKPDTSKDFVNELSLLLEAMPELIVRRAKAALYEFIIQLKQSISERPADPTNDLRDEAELVSRVHEMRATIEKTVLKYMNESATEFRMRYTEVISIGKIEKIIKDKGLKNRKGTLDIICGSLNTALDQALMSVLYGRAEQVAGYLNDLITDYNSLAAAGTAFKPEEKKSFNRMQLTSYDSLLRLYYGGTAQGAVAVPAFTAGGIGALLSVKAASAGLLAFAPLLIAPIVGVAALTAGFLAGSYKNWETKTAKYIEKYYNETRIIEKYEAEIQEFWKRVTKTIQEIIDAIEAELHRCLQDGKTSSTVNMSVNSATTAAMISSMESLPLE